MHADSLKTKQFLLLATAAYNWTEHRSWSPLLWRLLQFAVITCVVCCNFVDQLAQRSSRVTCSQLSWLGWITVMHIFLAYRRAWLLRFSVCRTLLSGLYSSTIHARSSAAIAAAALAGNYLPPNTPNASPKIKACAPVSRRLSTVYAYVSL